MPFVAALAVAVAMPAAASAASYGTRTLSVGAHGSDVKRLQLYLGSAGHRVARDGEFGPRTQRALRATETGARAARRRGRDQARAARDPARREGPGHRRRGLRGAAAAREGRPGRQGNGHGGRLRGAAESAPEAVKDVIAAGNAIAKTPYKWGGGHAQLGRHGLRLLRLRVLRAPRRRPARQRARLGRLRPLGLRRDPDAGSRSTPTAATSTWSWRACDSTRAPAHARARAGRWSSATRPASA